MNVSSIGYKALSKGINVNGIIYQLVKLELLKIDATYQRTLDLGRVQYLAKNFNPKLLGIVKCARRKNGKVLYVFDGQHRVATLLQRKANGLPVPDRVLVEIQTGSTRANEAQNFIGANDSRRVNASDMFHAKLAYNSEIETNIKDILESAGFTLGFNLFGKRPPEVGNEIASIANLIPAYKVGRKYFQAAIDTLCGWQFGDDNTPQIVRNGQVIYALALMFYRADKLNKVNFDKLYNFYAREILKNHLYDRMNRICDKWRYVKLNVNGTAKYGVFADKLIEMYVNTLA